MGDSGCSEGSSLFQEDVWIDVSSQPHLCAQEGRRAHSELRKGRKGEPHPVGQEFYEPLNLFPICLLFKV